MKQRHSLLNTILVISFLYGSAVPAHAAIAVVDYNQQYQTIEGFGGGLSFHVYPYNHPKKEELYDSIFNKAKVNVVRVGNWYNPQLDTPDVELPMMKEIQQRWPQVKTILTSWSPPPYLKSNDSISGCSVAFDTATIKKHPDGTYMYEEYGDYWLQSAKHFIDGGMKIDWLSIQNEPDWPAGHAGCVIEGRETPSIASYGKAHTAVYNKLKTGLDTMIPMIGPDVAGIYMDRVTRFITSPETNTSEMVAYCHHLYDHPGSDWFNKARLNIIGKPIYQTEFLINEGSLHGDQILSWLDNAYFIHQSLATEGASMYCVFALAYKPASMHTFFSMDTLGGDWYQPRKVYFLFKHFSACISRGWKRIEAATDDPALMMSAYCDADKDSTAVVFINMTKTPKSVSMEFAGKTAAIIQTSETRNYEQIGILNNAGSIALDSMSITTINLHNGFNNAQVATPLPDHKISRRLRADNVGGMIFVTGPAPAGHSVLSLFDCRGNRIATHALHHTTAVAASYLFNVKLSPGSYVVKLSNGNMVTAAKAAVVY